MSSPTVQIAKLIIYNAQKSRSLVSCFVTQPKISEEERGGRIFIISEIKQATSGSFKLAYQKFIDTLNASIKNNYYRQITYKPGPLELAFESALQQTNRTLGEYLKAGGNEILKGLLNNINIATGVIRNYQIHFSVAGIIERYLIRKNKIISVLPSTDVSPKDTQTINPFKIFSHIISGHLETDDGLLFCTESLLDYFSIEKLKRIITENEAHKANQYLQELLAEIDNKAAIAALIIKLISIPESSEKEPTKPFYFQKKKGFPRLLTHHERPTVQDSITKLLDQQQETSRIIAHQPFSRLKKVFSTSWFLKKITKPQANQMVTTIKSYAKIDHPKTKHFPTYTIANKFSRISKFILGPLAGLGNLLKTTPLKLDKFALSNLEKISRKATAPKKYFIKLPFSSKALLFICIVLGILFVQSIFLLNKRKIQERDVQAYNQLLEQIEESQNEASTVLIYGDEQKTRALFHSTLELIKKLPQDTEKRREKAAILFNETSVQLDKLNRIRTIKNPSLLVDASYLTFFEKAAPQEILLLQDKIYTYRSDNNALYTIDLGTGEIRALKNSSTAVGRISHMRGGNDDTIFFYHDGNGIAQFDSKKNALIPLELNKRTDIEIQDLAIYDSKLYLLAPNKNLILKYYKTFGGYAKETTWNKDETNLRNASSFAIDGSIWVIKSDGFIVNLMRGVEEDFNVPVVDPPLSFPTKIWTTKDSDNLYILDPTSKRIIILTKQGILKEQLTSNAFEDLKDFVIDEATKKIYILAGMKIYEVDID